jgi:exodeoxyribonuclease V alpha subunit
VRADLVRAARGLELGDDLVDLALELAALPPLLGDAERRALALLVLALLVANRRGATRLALDGEGAGGLRAEVGTLLEAAGLGEARAATLRLLKGLLPGARGQRLAGLVGQDDDHLPLLVADGGLYLQRDRARERRLAKGLADRLRRPATPAPALDDRDLGPIADEQRAAIVRLRGRGLAILAGGPGTGKTTTIAALLRALIGDGVPPARIALAAPTGKAAHRLGVALAGVAAIEPPRTLHRLLGYQPSLDRFRHDEHRPLDADVVIVDEATMIDLAMADRLVRALAPEASLILVGDPDQLPSVEAGAVVADLVALDARRPALGLVARLTTSHRVAPAGRGVLAAAEAVRGGRAAAARAALPRADGPRPAPGAAWLEVAADADVAALAAAWLDADRDDDLATVAAEVELDFTAGAPPPEHAALLDRIHAAHERRRILCATRRLPGGTDAINRALHARAPGHGALARAELRPGEPVILRANDYARGLWNGDTGVVVRGIDRPGERHHFRVAFPREGTWTSVRLDALRGQLELAWALTVHQAQGSEYDDVLVVLPAGERRVAGRASLYTAITRARRSALVVGDRAALDAAVAGGGERSAGLVARIEASLQE